MTDLNIGYALQVGDDQAHFDLSRGRLTSLRLGGQELILPDAWNGVTVYIGNARRVVVEPQNGPAESQAHELEAGQSLSLTTRLHWEQQQ